MARRCVNTERPRTESAERERRTSDEEELIEQELPLSQDRPLRDRKHAKRNPSTTVGEKRK